MFFMRAGGGLEWIDRGDAGGVDLAFAAMTVDNVFHDWDISAIIPAGTKLVLLRIWRMKAAGDEDRIKFRPKGGEDEYNCIQLTTNLNNENSYTSVWVRPDADRIIQYAVDITFTNANFIVGGWFK
jgi:hypothetical protein